MLRWQDGNAGDQSPSTAPSTNVELLPLFGSSRSVRCGVNDIAQRDARL